MHTSLFLISIFLCSMVDAQTYVIEDDYEPATFFDNFDFFTGADPTNGYVSYVDQGTAQNQGLINTNNGAVYMGVDHTNVATGSGRASVRISSKKSYNHGLIILDLAHMPGGICGTWPAFWMLGPNWPTNGEIDIIEGVNSAVTNAMTLHTNAGCSITNSATPFLGTLETPNCDVNAPGQAANAGCSIDSSNSQTFGAGFNAIGGGVFATEWTSEAISIYFFPRNAIPADITNGNPDPSGWGEPQAVFSGACDIDAHVLDQQLVFDTTFCGDWAGNVWSSDAVCSPLGATCQAYVQNNPSAFVNAYWSVNSLRVYSASGSTAAASTSAISSTVSLSTTTALTATTATSNTTPTSSTTSLISTTFNTFTTATSSTSSQTLLTTTVFTTLFPFSTTLSSTTSFTNIIPNIVPTPASASATSTWSSSWSTGSEQTSWAGTWSTPWEAPTSAPSSFGSYSGTGNTWNRGPQGGQGHWGRRRARQD